MAPALSRAVVAGSATTFVAASLFSQGSAFTGVVPRGAQTTRQQTQLSGSEGIATSSLSSALSGSSALAVLALGVAGAQASKSRTARYQAPVASADPVAVETVEPTAPPPPLPFDPAAQVGAVEPLGFFDPLGFTQVGDERGFNKLRAAEIKHGRVAMMASIGAIGQPFVKFPWFEGINGTFGALASGRATFGMFILFAACGILELAWREEDGKEPGNFGDPFGVDMYNEEMRNKEINNGRMAMISVLGIFAAELATGKNAIEQLFGF